VRQRRAGRRGEVYRENLLTRLTPSRAGHEEFSDYREHVAGDYVSHDVMREVKTDVVGAIRMVGERIDKLADARRPSA
jgi:hypothetical protein